MSTTTDAITPTDPVAHVDDIAEGSLTMVRVDGHRVCLVRTARGLHALDNACPHEGYGLTQGGLDGELLTCQWHNWKFRVTDGTCVQGEEAVPVHDVEVADDGAVRVTLNRPDPAAQRPKLMDSLGRAIARQYVGQISRDVIRLLHAGATPAEIMSVAVEFGAARGEYGWGHEIASATDCLAMVDLWDGDERALPLVQGIAGIAESMRDRPIQPVTEPSLAEASSASFRAAVEREDLDAAQSAVRAAIRRGDSDRDLAAWFTAAASDHHLSYGHGAIYTQKAFELLAMIGWSHADLVLTHLVTSIVRGTREDTLPYMRPFLRGMNAADLDQLADAATRPDQGWTGRDDLVAVLLDGDRVAPAAAVAEAFRAGAGIDGVLDAVVDAVSIRMLRYDVSGERDFHDDFGWLDITHGITYAHAVRWMHDCGGGADVDLVRLVFFAAFQANWTGRHEWHSSVGDSAVVTPLDIDVDRYGAALQQMAQLDGTAAFIVHAHAVKTSRAAWRECRRRDTTLALDATLHFLESPKLERFVAANVVRSLDFLNGRIRRE